MIAQKLLLFTMGLALMLSGCGDGRRQTPVAAKQAYLIANQVHPADVGNIIGTPPPTPAPGNNADPVTAGGDPLSAGVADDGNTLSSADPLSRAPGSSDSTTRIRPIKNWYWLVGAVNQGTIDVTVNGIPVGRYTSSVNKEISDFCNYGTNNVTINTTPFEADQPVTGELKIIYSQAPVGSPPVLDYTLGPTSEASAAPTAPAIKKFSAPTLPVPAPSIDTDPTTSAGINGDGSTSTSLSFVAS